MVEHAMYGSKQNTEGLINKDNGLWKQMVGFAISYFHKFC